MPELTSEGMRILDDLAQRYGVSPDAVLTLFIAVVDGGGTQAQFSHPDLGGMGQWSRGGMIMIGDMFNNNLKAKVDSLCNEISGLLHNPALFASLASSEPDRHAEARSGTQTQSQSQGRGQMCVSFVVGAPPSWWPSELGAPASTGRQNDLRYAYFPGKRRLAIAHDGEINVYDTGDHDIGGFSQQQGGDQSLTFTSQYGLVPLAQLRRVSPDAPRQESAREGAGAPATYAPVREAAPPPQRPMPASPQAPTVMQASGSDVLALIEKLAELRRKDILTEEEFAAKKAELLARL
jgi:hypothetical protein